MPLSPSSTLRAMGMLGRAGFRRYSTYRAAIVGGIVTNLTFGLLRMSVLAAVVVHAGGNVNGYQRGQIVAYVVWTQALISALNLFGDEILAPRIKTGEIAVDFVRPIHPLLAYLAADYGRAGLLLLARGVPTFTVGALVMGTAWPGSLTAAVLAPVSIAVAVTVSFGLVYARDMIGLWVVEVRGLRMVYIPISGFLAGTYVPVAWFPDWLQRLAYATPFPSMLQTPLDLLCGRLVSPGAAAAAVGQQLLWMAGVLAVAAWITHAGRRHLEVQGG